MRGQEHWLWRFWRANPLAAKLVISAVVVLVVVATDLWRILGNTWGDLKWLPDRVRRQIRWEFARYDEARRRTGA